MKPQVIIVNGMPGTGKTTLSRKLARDLSLPLIGKDDIKELLFDRLGSDNREWSKLLGQATSQFLFDLIDSLLSTDKQFMVENAFWYSFAHDEIAERLDRHAKQCLEIYCKTDRDERVRRFIARNESGERHPGHIDAEQYTTIESIEWESRYQPLGLGTCIEVDTTSFDDRAYAALVERLGPYCP
jgi:cytidylate kinase